MAANATMKAALVLSFKDELSAGLTKMEQQLEKLKKRGEQLTLGKLTTGSEDIQRTTDATRALVGELGNVSRAAKGAYADLNRMNGAYSGIHTQRSFSRNDAAMLWGGARAPLPERGAGSGGLGGMAGSLAAVGGGYAALASVRSYASFEDLARTAAIASGVTGPSAVGAESKRLQAFFSADALRTAQSGMSIGTAYSEMVGQGIAPAEAEGLLGVHSRVAEAYGIDSATLTPATAALNKNLGINADDMGGALAAMMTANYKGRFKAEDFARELPGITGDMATFGMKGRGAADQVFAALETVMQSSSVAGQGAANFKDFMDYLASPHAARSFNLQSRGMLSGPTRGILDKYHVTGFNMPQVLEQARMNGVDPITATLNVLQDKIKDLPPDVVKDVLGAFFTNSMSRDAAQALLLNRKQYEALRSDLHGIGADTLDKALEDRMAGAEAQTKLLDEELVQLERRLGAGLMPVVKKVVYGLDDLNSGMQWLDGKFPGLGDDVVSTTAAVLGVGGAFGALGLVLPKLAKGLMLFLTPVGRVAAALWGMEAGAFGASSVLGIELPASLAIAAKSMDVFTAAAMRNPLVKAGFLAVNLWDKTHELIFPPDMPTAQRKQIEEYVKTHPDGMPGASLLSGDSPNESGRLAHEEGGRTLNGGDSAAVPIPQRATVDIHISADPGLIPRVDSSGNVRVHNTPIYQLPDPGQTLGRP